VGTESLSWRGERVERCRATYFDLVSQGVHYEEAGRRAGVSRSTAYRWAHPEATQRYAQRSRERYYESLAEQRERVDSEVDLPPLAQRGRSLILAERIVIADHYRAGRAITDIAEMLGRDKSTVSREIERNSYPLASGAPSYGPYAAERRAEARRARPKTRKLETDEVLQAHVQDKLKLRWSPEQIARTLPEMFPEQPERRLCHETIYQALYVQGRGQLRRELTTWLRTGRAARRPRRSPEARQARFAEPMVMISERPAEAADRAVPGHWEGDLIVGKNHASAIATLVERTTRFTMLAALPGDYDAIAVRDALIALIGALPAQLTRSLAWDQGAEMARHHEFRVVTGVPVYFCDPASPWMRGSNENTNGLLRQYFPKGTDLSVHSPEHLAAVAAELNDRPRKTLNWASPARRLATLLAQADEQRCCDHP
jgi:transposase, IS30 family